MERSAKAAERKTDPFKIFMNAERFRIADRLLRADTYRQYLATVASPAIVLCAFSAELYSKCIISLETNSPAPRSHDLEGLYRKLSPKSRQRLESLWDEFASSPTAIRMRQAIKATTGDDIPADLTCL